jgi:hypothetical protein
MQNTKKQQKSNKEKAVEKQLEWDKTTEELQCSTAVGFVSEGVK